MVAEYYSDGRDLGKMLLNKSYRYQVLFLLLSLRSFGTVAQSETDSLSITLAEIVITDSQKQVSAFEPYHHGTSLRVINLLEVEPALQGIHENNYPIVYRGFHGNNLRIERNGALRTGINNQGYTGNDLDPGGVGTVKVITGLDKVLYGTGANGGVVLINSKDPRLLESRQIYSAFGSNNQSRVLGLQLPVSGNQKGLVLAARRNVADNFHFGGGEKALNSAFAQNNISLATFWDGPKTFKSTWNQQFSTGYWQRPQGFQNLPNEWRTLRNNFQYQSDLSLDWGKEGAFSEQIWCLIQNTDQNRDNYNFSFKTINESEERSFQKLAFGHRFSAKARIGQLWQIRYGTDFLFGRLRESRRREDFLRGQVEITPPAVSREELISGLFYKMQAVYPGLTLGMALRGDAGAIGHGLSIWHFKLTGALELGWTLTPHLHSSWTAGRYFRFPTQQEVSGEYFGGRGVFRGNPNLSAENSYQIDWKTTATFGRFMGKLTAWAALFSNRITEVLVEDGLYTFQNQERSRIMGVETEFFWELLSEKKNRQWHLIQRASFIRGDDISRTNLLASGDPIVGIPPGRLVMEMRYRQSFSKRISLLAQLGYEYVFPFKRLPDQLIRQTWGVQAADAYALVNAHLECRLDWPGTSLEAGVSLVNLLDVAYYPFGTRIHGMGRNVSLFIRSYF